MSVTHVLVASIVSGLLALTILGTVTRRWALCRTFPLYLLACFSGNALITLRPDRYWTPEFYALKETVYGGLQMAVALELAIVILRPFPRALMRVLGRLLGVLAVGGIMAAVPRPSYFQALALGLPLEQACVSWMFMILVFAVIWHRIPLGRYHRDVLGGFAFYVLVFAALLGATARFGWSVFTLCLQSLDPAAFAMTVGIWAVAAWREDEQPSPRRGSPSSPRGKRFLLVATEALAGVLVFGILWACAH